MRTSAGELILQPADGSDARQQWMRSLVFKILLPHLFSVLAAGFAVKWAVACALKPLLDLKHAAARQAARPPPGFKLKGFPC
ncbi:MAG: sensor histidine kinase [Polaromonas sp.]|nr:sensor histidine kinase [Polaromonas sp.]